MRPAGAQGGTSACRTGAALSFVSCIRLLGGLADQAQFSSFNPDTRLKCWVLLLTSVKPRARA
jgi:hypothetical protein